MSEESLVITCFLDHCHRAALGYETYCLIGRTPGYDKVVAKPDDKSDTRLERHQNSQDHNLMDLTSVLGWLHASMGLDVRVLARRWGQMAFSTVKQTINSRRFW